MFRPGASDAVPPVGEEQPPLLHWQGDTPFPVIQAGDEVLPRCYMDGKPSMAGLVLKATKIRHCIAEIEGLIDHSVFVFTECVREPKTKS